MNWFYVHDGLQHGPISEAQLNDLARAGKIRQDTLVWREGLTTWQAFATALPPAPMGVAGDAEMPCAECGRYFPASDVIMLNHLWVCGGCKPIFLQRLTEGVAVGAVSHLWRVKNQLVTRSETPFPDRCVRCNAPAKGYRLKRQFTWHPPIYFLLVLISILVYIIVVIFVRKKAVLHLGLCEKHRVRRKWGIGACLVGLFGGFTLFLIGITSSAGYLAWGGALAFVAGIIWGVITGVRVSAAKIDKDTVWLRGVNRDFLDQLPEWNG